MWRLLTIITLTLFPLAAFGDEPDLVEAAKRAATYWSTLFGQCGSQSQNTIWYAVVHGEQGAASVQMVTELSIQFKTEELSREERLNGFEFKATTSLEQGPFRWWFPRDKAWRDWQIGEIAPPVVLIKKKGVW